MSERWKGALDAFILLAAGAALAIGADVALWRGVVVSLGLALLAAGVIRVALSRVQVNVCITQVLRTPDDDDPDEDEIEDEPLPPPAPREREQVLWN